MQEVIINFIKQHAVEIGWIVVLFLMGKIILNYIVKHLVNLADDGDDNHTSKKEKRAKTLGLIIKSIGNVFIYSLVLFMVLNLSGINIGPVLASAGIVGLAIGFGAQSLVKDFVSGIFILIENQYGVGDTIIIGNFEGEVIKISMRSTVLMDKDKNTHYISNGLIKNVTNLSQKKSRSQKTKKDKHG